MEKEYFVLRRAHCGTLDLKTGKMDTDIIGITDDEEFAKSQQSVFCYYEKVKFLEKDLITSKIKEIAETYHDRLVMAGMSGGDNKCECCGTSRQLITPLINFDAISICCLAYWLSTSSFLLKDLLASCNSFFASTRNSRLGLQLLSDIIYDFSILLNLSVFGYL